MKSKEQEKILKALSDLQQAAEDIRRIEAEAQEALFSLKTPEVYREKLQEKIMLLMELPETIEPSLQELSGKAKEEIEAGVNDLARRATRAWELSSTFYMSALLYPEDYKEGEMNDLENLIGRLRSKYIF